MKLNTHYELSALVLNAVTTLVVVISMAVNWLAYHHRAELMRQVADLQKIVVCLDSAKERDRQKCIQ